MDEFCGNTPPLAMAPGSGWWQPHGHCVVWEPLITWTWTICDLLIWASYLAIPMLLFRHLKGTRLIVLLPWTAPFIIACGMGHLWDALTVWRPWYGLVTASRIVTAVVSLASVVGLAYVLPRVTYRLETALRDVTVGEEAQEFVDSLLPLAAFVCTPDGGDLAVNSAYTQMLGYSLDEVRGYLYLHHVYPEDREIAGDRWRAFCFGVIPAYRERFRWFHPEGLRHLEVKGTHRSNGQHYGIVTDRTDEVHHSRLMGGHNHADE